MPIILPINTLNNTVANIIEYALLEIGVISEGDTVESTMLETAVFRFNSLVQSLMNEKVPLHAIDTTSVTMVADTTDYNSAEGTVRVLSFADLGIDMLSQKDYDNRIATGVSTGNTCVYVDYGSSLPVLKFINPPEEGTEITYRRSVMPTLLGSAEVVEYPLECTELLIMGLAFKLARSYGVDDQKRMMIAQEYAELKTHFIQKSMQRNGDEIVRPSFVV